MAYSYKNKNRGFTLAELMVTVVIMMIMTGVVIFNYGKFNESSVMNQIAYDLSLTIRQAQVYGIAAKESGSGQSGVITTNNAKYDTAGFKSAYGVSFDKNNNNNQFILFVDNYPGNGQYTSDEQLQIYNFSRGIYISDLCVGTIDPVNCNKAKIDITFLRPDPEAKIKIPSGNSAGPAIIVLKSADGNTTKSVWVYSSGQISVK